MVGLEKIPWNYLNAVAVGKGGYMNFAYWSVDLLLGFF